MATRMPKSYKLFIKWKLIKQVDITISKNQKLQILYLYIYTVEIYNDTVLQF